jgi:hypothetical protein
VEFLFHDIDPFLGQVLAVIIILIWKVNKIVLCKEDHSRGANIAFTRNDSNAALKTPAMRDFTDREEFVKVFFCNFVSVITDHVVKKLIDWKT